MDFSLEGLRTLIAQSGQQELIINIICIIGILIALANCFMGYRLLNVWVVLLGILLGAFCGYHIGVFFRLSTAAHACVILVLAVLLAVLARYFRQAGSVVLCAAMAFSLSYYFLLYNYGYTNVKGFLIAAAIISILCGLLAHLLKKPVIIIITALCGSYTAWSSFSSLVHFYVPQKLFWIIVAGLGALGVIAQFFLVNRGPSGSR